MLSQAQFQAIISKKRATLLRQQQAVDATTAELELLVQGQADAAALSKQLDIEQEAAKKGPRK